MKKFAYYFSVTSILILFIFLMNSGNFFAKSMSDNFMSLRQDLQAEDWEQAEKSYQSLNLAWQKVAPRIQFSVEKGEINAIDVNLSKIGAYITLREKSGAYVELNEAIEHWNNLNN
ncbi:hypothetical protein ASZ90_017544 [hydrocarbon metagenome]|uniref:DUF4363 family protein n=1 Tax=hydrocarbon metagenome TaxID=938273 RepID=A0A0W8E8U0_9ZZZZ